MIADDQIKHADITNKILHAFFKKVYHRLGYGFLEKVYENALAVELRRMGLKVEQQVKIIVFYEDEVVGEYFADLLVEGIVIVELKAARQILGEHEASASRLSPHVKWDRLGRWKTGASVTGRPKSPRSSAFVRVLSLRPLTPTGSPSPAARSAPSPAAWAG